VLTRLKKVKLSVESSLDLPHLRQLRARDRIETWRFGPRRANLCCMESLLVEPIQTEVAESAIQIRVGYELVYECPQPTPMIFTLNIHPERVQDIVVADRMTTDPAVPLSAYYDGFGNRCTRLVAPAGRITISATGLVRDSGLPDAIAPFAPQNPVEHLPQDTLIFLLGSRYCETDRLSQTAWDLFGGCSPGWPRVQAICDFVHSHITFEYQHARPTKTAWEAFNERAGVCRDFAHLALTFCRCMNIPARYCTGYLGDIGVPVSDAPMDFAGWFEAYLGDRWYTFDPRNHEPRIGRVVIARGRDAADVAISSTFGPSVLTTFRVQTDQVF
jgi:transglutaminase-like putative cysteine protease